MITFWSVQCHPGLTYIFNFWHSGTLELSPDLGMYSAHKHIDIHTQIGFSTETKAYIDVDYAN